MTAPLRAAILDARRRFASDLRALPRHQVHIGKNGCVAIVPGEAHRKMEMKRRSSKR